MFSIIDTAGRLQNKSALMAELEKVIRVIRKLDRAAPHSVLLTSTRRRGKMRSPKSNFTRRQG